MNKKKQGLFYTRYLQKKIYFRKNDVVNALFNLEKYLLETLNLIKIYQFLILNKNGFMIVFVKMIIRMQYQASLRFFLKEG